MHTSKPEITGNCPKSDLALKDWINKETEGEEGFIALHFAAFNGSIEMVKELVSRGGDIWIPTVRGSTMMHYAAQGDHPGMLAFLKE